MSSTKSNDEDDNNTKLFQEEDKYQTQPLQENELSLTSSFKLPKINNRPLTRIRAPSHKQTKPNTVIFPSLNLHNQSQTKLQQNFRNTQILLTNNNNQILIKKDEEQYIYKDDFVLDMESKLKSILGQGNQYKIKNKNQISLPQQDDNDFEQKINQNKQFIKMHKQQQKIDKKSQITQIKLNIQPSQKFIFNPNKLIKQKSAHPSNNNNKPQSNYQKKMKEYNFNNSLENKYLQRKKQSLGIIVEKAEKPITQQYISNNNNNINNNNINSNNKPLHVQRAKSKKILSMKDTLDEAKINFGYKQFKSNAQINNQNSQNNKPSSLASFNQNNNGNNAIKNSIDRMSKKPQKRKTEQSTSPRRGSLFDNIQTLLENPTAVEKHDKFYKQIAKKLKNKDMNKLQEQIREITEKIGINYIQNVDDQHGNKQKIQTNVVQTKKLLEKLKDQSNGTIESNAFLLTQHPEHMQRTVRDWKRIQLKNNNKLKYQQSNFQKQLDYISYLQQKNSSSLTKFIDQQKIMVQLHLNRRFSKSIGKDELTNLNLMN